MPTETREASDSCTHLPVLPLAFLPRAVVREGSSLLLIRLSFATFQEEGNCERDFRAPIPAFLLPTSLPVPVLLSPTAEHFAPHPHGTGGFIFVSPC